MRVGIMGLGYVGLPLAVAFAEEGHDVVGVDIDTRKVEALARGESFVEDVAATRLLAVNGRLEATTRASNLSRCDAVIVCVPTPLTDNREPDLGPLLAAARVLSDVLQVGQLVVLESTTYPGTTREQHRARIAASHERRRVGSARLRCTAVVRGRVRRPRSCR